MFYIFIILGVVALILSIYLFVDGILFMVSRNKIGRGLLQIGAALLSLVFAALMGIFLAGMLAPAAA